MLIKTANQQEGVRAAGGYRQYIERVCAVRWNYNVTWQRDRRARRLLAFVDKSNWVYRCECGEQVVAETSFPLAFCPNCLNAEFNHLARVIEFPNAIMRPAIEMILLARWYPENRNWLLGETLDDLIAENIQHKEVNRLEYYEDGIILKALKHEKGKAS